MSISFFDDLGVLFLHFSLLLLLGSLGHSSEVKHNIKMNFSIFNDLGGLFSHFGQLLLLGLHGRSSEVERNPKTSISFFWLERWQMGLKSINQPSRSSEVECNPKMSISSFWLERGGGWGSSPSISPADHQKLNIIQK